MACNSQYPATHLWAVQPVTPSPTKARVPPSPCTTSVFPAHQPYLPNSVLAVAAPSVAPLYGAHYSSKSGANPLFPTSSLPIGSVNDGTTIFLSGLAYYQTENKLRGVLKRYGHVIYLEIHPDSRNPGRNKGTARARYESSSDALSAVRDLDGQYLQNRKISVKQEKK